jgi:Xaa-Pro aminopeptidase
LGRSSASRCFAGGHITDHQRYSTTAVTALKEAVLAAVVPENTSNGIRFDRAIIDGERDLGERVETQFIHRASVDLMVWWATA